MAVPAEKLEFKKPEFVKRSDVIWDMLPGFKSGMRVPARIIATRKLIDAMDEQVAFETRAVLAPRRARLSRLALLVPALALVATAWAGLSGRSEQDSRAGQTAAAASRPTSLSGIRSSSSTPAPITRFTTISVASRRCPICSPGSNDTSPRNRHEAARPDRSIRARWRRMARQG